MIHFVGAGSGAVDLITIRGAELLKEADLIIYAGSLVNPDLLNYAKDSCEIYDSAKMTLDEVLEKMFEAEKEGLQNAANNIVQGNGKELLEDIKILNLVYKSYMERNECYLWRSR